jgi:hypothetical protein
MRRSPGWFREALNSGELARAAQGAASWNEVARRLGVSSDALINAKVRAINAGAFVPTLGELQRSSPERDDAGSAGQTVTERDGDTQIGDADTQVGYDEKWPSLAAFDDLQPVVPEQHAIKGVSTLLDADGNVKQQWVKTTAANDERAQWLKAVRSIEAELPRLDPVPAPQHCDKDLLAVYPVGDPHIGLLAWHEDSGENFDLDIAETNLVGAFQHLTALAPDAAEALLIFIGDNNHADGQSNTTTRGTRVDTDGRFVKITRSTIRVGRRAVDLALQKHKRVRLIWERGNHDELISAMTALAFSLIYENDPRVTVDTSPEMFHWFRFGANLIGTHHGDKVKPMDLLGVMAVDRQQDWGETTHRRFYAGHYHHQIVKEVPGLIVEYLPTLAGSDAWHRSMGYRSSRAMYMDVLHREHGHINRHIVGVGQLRSRAA